MTTLILAHLYSRITTLHRRLSAAPARDGAAHPDDGYTTETIAVIALLVVLALSVIGIIAAKVLTKASGISL